MRQTEDIDIALAVQDWSAFEQLRARLVASGSFAASKLHHRLRHGEIPIDLVPFGNVETADRKISWPPQGEFVMDVFGFQEAQKVAIDVLLPGDVQARVVPLPALALLKLVCWQDRYLRSPRKDAADLQLIMASYLQAGNDHRLWDEFLPWTQDDDFDYEAAGARMLGHDIAMLVDAVGREGIAGLLASQAGEEHAAPLPLEMHQVDPERARRMLGAALRGLMETAK